MSTTAPRASQLDIGGRFAGGKTPTPGTPIIRHRWQTSAGTTLWRDIGSGRTSRLASRILIIAIVCLAYLAGSSSEGTVASIALDMLFMGLASTAIVLMGRAGIRAWRHAVSKSCTRETLIVGSGPQALAFYEELSRDPTRRVLGFVDSGHTTSRLMNDPLLLGPLEHLDDILMRTIVDEVIVALPIKSKYEEIQTAIGSCERAGVECLHSAHLFSHTLARPRFESREFPAVRMLMVEDDERLIVKRAVDIVGACLMTVLCLPLIIAIGVAVKATSAGPVFFVQERYGYRKRRFKMYKFRTMVENAEALLPEVEPLNEASGHAFKIRHDPRLTPIGSFLRRWSLDELPQFLNVLKGDMSLVGPRPMSIRDVWRFSDGWLMRRFSVRPGLTCLWQINGRSNLTFEDWMTLDLQYIDSWSTRLDLRILARTIPAVLKRSGAV